MSKFKVLKQVDFRNFCIQNIIVAFYVLINNTLEILFLLVIYFTFCLIILIKKLFIHLTVSLYSIY